MRSLVKLAAKIPLYHSFRAFGYPKILPFNYTFSLTYRCNSRCKTCNIWKIQKNFANEELTEKEWKKIIKSLSNSPFWMTISGGEPFLRFDIDRIVKYSIKKNKPRFITIPTNGLINSRDKIEKILKTSKKTILIINFSLDGIGKNHDYIRGISGNWEKLVKNYFLVKELKDKFDNLVIGIHTVISKWNYSEIPKIYSYVENNLKPDHHIFELAENRGELFNQNKKLLPEKKELLKTVRYILSKTARELCCRTSLYVKTLRKSYYKYLIDVLTKSKYIKSFAGFASVEISPVGRVIDCAIYAREMGNLKDFNYDFKKLWLSEKAEAVREINKSNHNCILANEFYSNAILNIKPLFFG
ncbi:MAG: radical SAM protein [Candidatus Aenigmarchaeota archaeon]|nr:radical SAM protein [Candidatus Aenigmarchaeota archaeon]